MAPNNGRNPGFSPKKASPRPLAHALLIALVVSTMVAASAILWQGPLPWAPATLVAIMLALYAASSIIDRRARKEPRLPSMPVEARTEAIREAKGRVGVKTMITIGVALGAVAIVLASAVFEWRVVGVGALAFFLLLVFFGLPIWVTVIQEEVGAEQESLTGTPIAVQRSPASSTLGGPTIPPPEVSA